MNKTNKLIFPIFFIFLFNCINAENKIIEKRTAEELITAFSIDWKNANEFYHRKRIEISGICIGVNRAIDPVPGALGIGSIAIANELPFFETENEFIQLMKNSIIISCHFNKLDIKLSPGDKLILIGDYYDFRNSSIAKAINLRNCIVIDHQSVN